MPRVDLDTITFETGSWEITPDQIDRLAVIAKAIKQAIARNPDEVFLIEGHTDAVGADVDNLSLSDRRAESVAVALTEQFQVPAENLTTQGYGEQHLKVPDRRAGAAEPPRHRAPHHAAAHRAESGAVSDLKVASRMAGTRDRLAVRQDVPAEELGRHRARRARLRRARACDTAC